MSNNPYSPDFDPGYTGPPSDGSVGTGSDFGVDLFSLYEAGRIGFPESAKIFSQLSVGVFGIESDLRTEGYDNAGYQVAVSQLLELRQELEDALDATSSTLERTGEALVSIAAEYAATDREASDKFAELYRENLSEFPVASLPGGGRPVPFE